MKKEVYTCEICGAEFKVQKGLTNHKKRLHAELFDYKCQICGELAEDLKGLMIHVSKKHKNPEYYFNTYLNGKEICRYEKCNNILEYDRFSGYYCCKSHYESQKKLDDGIELKYVCQVCNTGFEEIGSLQQHLTKVHGYDVNKNKEYYDKYFKTDDEGQCLYCGKEVHLIKNSFSEGYMRFCYNTDCNVRWHNENTNRLENMKKTLSETHKNNPEISPLKKEYWMAKGYSESRALEKLTERQTTFSKELCVEKHGETEGLKIWQDRQEKWMNTLDSKPDEEKNRINRLKAYSSGCISNAERELCNKLNAESSFVISSDIGYVYDIRKGNKIIEYHGDYWHCNPNKYDKNYYNEKIKMTAQEKWHKDKEKIMFAKNSGYDVKVVWEYDYNKDKQKVIQECLDFLKG